MFFDYSGLELMCREPYVKAVRTSTRVSVPTVRSVPLRGTPDSPVSRNLAEICVTAFHPNPFDTPMQP